MQTADVLEVLNRNNYSILSAPADRFGDLVRDIVEMKQNLDHIGHIVIVRGRYDGVEEDSVLVEGLTDYGAMGYGEKYQQECILNSYRGFIYTDGSRRDDVGRVRTQDVIEVLDLNDDARLDSFDNASIARVSDGYVLFTLGLDF